jgi:RHS repeat-associated protein
MLAEYIYLGDKLLAMIKPGENVYYFHNDHLGTPQVLTNDSQAIAWKAVYTPFGEAVPSIQTVENPFRFPGQYYDQETGLHYNYFRYYNPQTGRYITPDPIGLEGGINLFVYVANNPINFADPFGLRIIKWAFNAGAHVYLPPTFGAWGFNIGSIWTVDYSTNEVQSEFKGIDEEYTIGSFFDFGVSAGITGLSGCEKGTERTLSLGLGKYGGAQFTFKGGRLDAISVGLGRGLSLPVTFTIPLQEFFSRF